MPYLYLLGTLNYSVCDPVSATVLETVDYFSHHQIRELATAAGSWVVPLDSYRLSGPLFLTSGGLLVLTITSDLE